jgi:hypothetical protein
MGTAQSLKIEYPHNTAVCETDEHWAGRNMLRNAFLASKGQSREYKGQGPAEQREILSIVRPDRPLYWSLESPETQGRTHFSQDLALRDAACVRAFLSANGVSVTAEEEPVTEYLRHTPWQPSDPVRVYGTGTHADPYASDSATLAILPGTKRALWNLVRFNYDEYEF